MNLLVTKKSTKKIAKKTAKKVVSKKVSKKNTKKKTVRKATKKTAKTKPKISINSPKAKGEECFYVTNGLVIDDLLGLVDALDTMTDDVFYHHVNDERNDFANWVKEIMKEAELAEKIMSQNTPDRCQIVILRHFLK